MKIARRPMAQNARFRRTISCALIALAIAAIRQPAVSAHDIPDEIVLQTYIKPAQNRLQVLLRIPLIAITDANLPKDGIGYLAMAHLDPALREAANQISNGIVFLEEDARLAQYEMLYARISLPSDRSFNTYGGAVARVRGPKLPDSTQVYYNQGFLDLELAFPVRSESSRFSMRVLFGRGLAQRTATYINFIRPDGGVRAFRIHDDTPLVRLDPTLGQAAWVFLSAGFYRFLDGLDHLLFVIALAIPFRRARDLIKPIAAFAAAHSVALAAAAFGTIPADAWFAPAIGAIMALSIVYVAIENGVGRALGHRWIVALAFGAFHGLGFAMALEETLQFAGAHPIAALLAYNVGLELGMLIILAISVPAFTMAFAHLVSERAGIIVSSLVAGHVGWHWMIERFTVAQLSGWPALDLQLMLTLVRWLLAITIVGGLLWFVRGVLRRKSVEPEAELSEKSIVDSR